MPPIGPSSELTNAGRPYELTLLVSTVLVRFVIVNDLLDFVYHQTNGINSLLHVRPNVVKMSELQKT